MTSRAIDVNKVFENGRFSPYQHVVCSLCFLVTFLDGFDLTIIGVALPGIADFLHSRPGILGLALGASQVGPVIGALLFGPLGDRWGRKSMLVISSTMFGAFTLMTAFITSAEQLALYRFLAGLGLGGATPSALTLGSEYAPISSRATVVSTIFAGAPAGSMLGGLCAAALIPSFGWQSLFVLGGGVTLVIALVVALFLPESLHFLVQKGKHELEIRKIVSKIMPVLGEGEKVCFTSSEKKPPGVPVKHLFTEGRALATLLLWALCTFAGYMVWVLVAWAPTLLRNTGASVQQYSLAFAGLMFGGVVASILVGRLMDKVNPFRVLEGGFVLAFISLAAFGFVAGGSFMLVAIFSVVCGIFINGSQTGTMAIATVSYPPTIRSSGIGWTYGIAKIGAITAPVVGGIMLSYGWSTREMCGTNALAGLVVAVLLAVLHGSLVSRRSKSCSETGVGCLRGLLRKNPLSCIKTAAVYFVGTKSPYKKEAGTSFTACASPLGAISEREAEK